MANTFTLISTTTVGAGGAASIDFNSIPGTYTDLHLLGSVRSSNTGFRNIYMRFNGDTGANYSNRLLYTADGTVGSASETGATYIRFFYGNGNNTTSNTFSSWKVDIPNYSGSTAKSISTDSVTEHNGTTPHIANISAGLWTGTSAITSINFTMDGANFEQYSVISLYGILKGSGGATVS